MTVNEIFKDLIEMKTLAKLLTAAALSSALLAGPVLAAGKAKNAKDIAFSFEGPFGTYDRAQLQRGFQVYKEVCAACHSANLLSYRNLGEHGGPEFSEAQVKAIAAEVEVQDGPNEEGEMFDRPGRPSDKFKAPFSNDNEARASNGGALPPDLSLITKAREGFHYPWYVSPFIKMWTGNGGPEYVHAVLTGYSEPSEKEAADAPEGKSYNAYYASGPWISMAPPLSEDGVEYSDGTKASVDQQAKDVSAFLAWAAEPKMEERKTMGLRVMIYLLILAILMYLVKLKLWRNVEH